METRLSIRLNQYVKFELEERAFKEELSLSEYVRNLLEEHVGYLRTVEPIDQAIDEQPIRHLGTVIVPMSISVPFEKTSGFTYLITWLFYKKMHPDIEPTETNFEYLKTLVKSVLEESTLSRELKLEFMKVDSELNRFFNGSDYAKQQFYFSIAGNNQSLNYHLLIKEVLNTTF